MIVGAAGNAPNISQVNVKVSWIFKTATSYTDGWLCLAHSMRYVWHDPQIIWISPHELVSFWVHSAIAVPFFSYLSKYNHSSYVTHFNRFESIFVSQSNWRFYFGETMHIVTPYHAHFAQLHIFDLFSRENPPLSSAASFICTFHWSVRHFTGW